MSDQLEEQMEAKTEELIEGRQGREAVLEAEELVQIDPKDAIVWFLKGKAHYISNEFDDALACFSKAAEMDRENPQIWQMMGYSLITLERAHEAEESLAYVKATQPSNVEAIVALGISQVMQNKPVDAKENFDLAISLNKKLALTMIEHCFDKYFSVSKDTQSRTKAMIERVLETIKLIR